MHSPVLTVTRCRPFSGDLFCESDGKSQLVTAYLAANEGMVETPCASPRVWCMGGHRVRLARYNSVGHVVVGLCLHRATRPRNIR